MTRRNQDTFSAPSRLATRLGGHVVLDLLNTVEHTDTGIVDHLSEVDAVRQWLEESGITIEALQPETNLVTAITDLREVIRPLIQHRLSGSKADPTALNAYLKAAEGYWMLEWPAGSEAPRRRFIYKEISSKTIVAPLADAAAELLAREDFSVVKRCGNPECTRFFYDPSATSRRRWCDMSSCGNRMKVAAFRQRLRPTLQTN